MKGCPVVASSGSVVHDSIVKGEIVGLANDAVRRRTVWSRPKLMLGDPSVDVRDHKPTRLSLETDATIFFRAYFYSCFVFPTIIIQ